MSTALFNLDDFEETRIEWVPLFKPFGITLLSLIIPDRCRDCGRTDGRAQHACSGSRDAGSFVVCDDCSAIDGCREETFQGRPIHVSRWGRWHPAYEHDRLVTEREHRRDLWRAKQRRSAA